MQNESKKCPPDTYTWPNWNNISPSPRFSCHFTFTIAPYYGIRELFGVPPPKFGPETKPNQTALPLAPLEARLTQP